MTESIMLAIQHGGAKQAVTIWSRKAVIAALKEVGCSEHAAEAFLGNAR